MTNHEPFTDFDDDFDDETRVQYETARRKQQIQGCFYGVLWILGGASTLAVVVVMIVIMLELLGR